MIFVGGIYLAESEEKIRLNSKCGIDNASNNLQLAILDGLDLYYPDMTIVSMTPIGTYPLRYKKLFHKGAIFSHKINATDYSLGFVNIPLIKHFCIYLNLNRTLNKLLYTAAEENAKEEVLIITYGVSSPKLKAI